MEKYYTCSDKQLASSRQSEETPGPKSCCSCIDPRRHSFYGNSCFRQEDDTFILKLHQKLYNLICFYKHLEAFHSERFVEMV